MAKMPFERKKKRMPKRIKEEILKIYLKNPRISGKEVMKKLREKMTKIRASKTTFSMRAVRYFLKKVRAVYPPYITTPYRKVLLMFSRGFNRRDLLSKAENFLIEEIFGNFFNLNLKSPALYELKSQFFLHSSFPGTRILSVFLIPHFIHVNPEPLLAQIYSWNLVDGGTVLEIEEENITVSQEFYDITKPKIKGEKETSEAEILLSLFLTHFRTNFLKQFLSYEKVEEENETKKQQKYPSQNSFSPPDSPHLPKVPASPITIPVEDGTFPENLSQEEREAILSFLIHKDPQQIELSSLKDLLERKALAIIPKIKTSKISPQMNALIFATSWEENLVKDLVLRQPYSHNFKAHVTRSFGDVNLKPSKKLFFSISKVFSTHLTLLLKIISTEIPQTFLIRVIVEKKEDLFENTYG